MAIMHSNHHNVTDAGRIQPDKLTYRPMRWSDLDMAAACFERVWMQGQWLSGVISGLLARYLLLHYLQPCTWSNLCVTASNTLGGLTLAQVHGQEVLFPQVGEALENVRHAMLAEPAGVRALDMLEHDFFPEELKLERASDVQDNCQAELALFMVDPDLRGEGVGRTLWEELMHAFARFDVEHYHLYTDSTCDYGFYDHKGLTRVQERLHADHPEDTDNHMTPSIINDMFIYRGTTRQQ